MKIENHLQKRLKFLTKNIVSTDNNHFLMLKFMSYSAELINLFFKKMQGFFYFLPPPFTPLESPATCSGDDG